MGDGPEERSPFLDEVSEKLWNEVSERFENAGEERVEGEIDADLLIEGGRLLGGGGAGEVSFASAQVFPAREEKEATPLVYSCNNSSKLTSSLQLFVSVGTTELPFLRLLDNSFALLFLPPFFFRSAVAWLETLMGMGREDGLW